jgi:hypothetical protein
MNSDVKILNKIRANLIQHSNRTAHHAWMVFVPENKHDSM